VAIREQLEAIFDDIVPDSIKIGMLFSEPIIELVAEFLSKHAAGIPIVLDPVMVAKSGDQLLRPDAVEALKTKLIGMTTIITPNLPEAYNLVGRNDAPTLSSQRRLGSSDKSASRVAVLNDLFEGSSLLDPSLRWDDAGGVVMEFEELGKRLLGLGSKAVLLKGGHSDAKGSDDLFLNQAGCCEWLKSERVQSKNTHGTGCTLSAAICAFLAQGLSLLEACKAAKSYLFGAMLASKEKSVGYGHGPVHHFYNLWPELIKDKI
jgi:hydroxymethylpyrimidine/phosphomethylpyrimidine kinase